MSHYSVLVVTADGSEEQIKAALQPFHEFECTGIRDEFVVWVDQDDEYRAEYQEPQQAWRRDGVTLERYDDAFYRDPTPEEAPKVGSGLGVGNGLSWASKDWGDGRGYRTKVKMPDQEIEAAGWVSVQVPRSDFYSFEEWLVDYHGLAGKLHEHLRNGRVGRYTNPNAKWDWWTIGGRWKDSLVLRDLSQGDTALKGELGEEPEPFAILHDGEWIQRGEMGWWAVVIDENPDWAATRAEAFKRIPDDAFVTLVDCRT